MRKDEEIGSYGVSEFWDRKGGLHIEELLKKGFTIIENAVDLKVIDEIREELEVALEKQNIGRVNLPEISSSENSIVRASLLFSDNLRGLVTNDNVLEIVSSFLSTDVFQLQLQNANKVESEQGHFQANWHRDLPYQHWTSSRPISCNVFYPIDDFTEENGATLLLPYSQHFPDFPSKEFAEKYSVSAIAARGSAIIFDSMLYHRAGRNRSNSSRWGVNNVYTQPFLKQQIDLTDSMNEESLSDRERTLFGFTYKTPSSVEGFLNRKG